MKSYILSALLLANALLPISAAQSQTVVANPGNHSPADLALIKLMLTGKERFWQDGAEVVIVTLRSDDKIDEALNEFCGMSASKFKNHWQRIVFSGRGKMPKQFATVEELVAYVEQTKGAIAIVSDEKSVQQLRRIN